MAMEENSAPRLRNSVFIKDCKFRQVQRRSRMIEPYASAKRHRSSSVSVFLSSIVSLRDETISAVKQKSGSEINSSQSESNDLRPGLPSRLLQAARVGYEASLFVLVDVREQCRLGEVM